MVKTAIRGVELEPIDRLEEKIKLLVGMVDRMKAEQARTAEENQRLSRYVDEKMKAAGESTPSGDPLRLAILAALNIADELLRCRDVTRARDGELAERAGELEKLLDRVLAVS